MTSRKKLGTSLGFFALGLCGLAIYFWVRQVNLVTLPEDKTIFMVVFGTSVLMSLAAFIIGARWFGAIPAIIAILASGFMGMSAYISPQQVADNPIKVGDVIPQFVALDDQSNRFNSRDLEGKPALIKFFRGHW